jgi:hypothetical protein
MRDPVLERATFAARHGFEPIPSYQHDLWRYERLGIASFRIRRRRISQQGVLQMRDTSNWNRPGVLDISAGRAASEPLRQM